MRRSCSRLGGIVLVVASLGCGIPRPVSPTLEPSPETHAPPRLILQITVDQLRGDLPGRFLDRYGEGGIGDLLEGGLWYTNAHYAHANTETIVGHATLATGAQPATHGMIGNLWFDRETGEVRYNIEDPDHPLLSEEGGVDAATEIDPTQRAARTDGRSPAAIRVSTFSDELAAATSGRAKIFGVSVKDRGAVALAGHAGKAFWFSKSAGRFVTSRYYYDAYPAWVEEWNARGLPARHAGQAWELLHDPSSYVFGEADDQPWETALPGYGRVFPHPFGDADGKLFTTLLTLSPVGDELTVDFAKALVQAEGLGADDIPDYLSVSLSSTDYVGHVFGPSSLEAEDNLLRLDRSLADLLSFIDDQVGLEHTLVVLAADHGSPEAPGFLNAHGIPGHYIDPDAFDREPALAELRRKLGVAEGLIESYAHPYVYLDRARIREAGLDLDVVARAVAEEIGKLDGISEAVASADVEAGRLAGTRVHRAIVHNHDPERSGEIYVVFDPHCFVNDFDGLTVAATHGSPWSYDTFVPIVFAGGGIEPARIARPVQPADIAPTLSAVLGLRPPSGADGQPLPEVLAGW